MTFFSTLFLELEFAIMAGVLLSLGLYLNRTSRPKLLTPGAGPAQPRYGTSSPTPACRSVPSETYRLDGSLFFGAVSHVAETLAKMEEQHPGQRHLVISATGINFIDVAGAEFLAEEANRRRSMGGGLYLIRLKPGVCEPLNRGGYIDAIGRENLFTGKTEALAAVTRQARPRDLPYLHGAHLPGVRG